MSILPSDTTVATAEAPTAVTAKAENNIIIQNNIHIEAPRPALARRQAKPAGHTGKLAASTTSEGVVTYAPDGDKLTTYTGNDGATATYREDAQARGAVTLTLRDTYQELVTHGTQRGFASDRRDDNDVMRHTQTIQDSKLGGIFHALRNPFGGTTDRIDCPSPQKDVNLAKDATDAVTLRELQDFAAKHGDLASKLRKEGLSVTMKGANQLDFGEVLEAPSALKACPTGKPYLAVERTAVPARR